MLKNAIKYYKKYTGTSGSIVTALNTIGVDSSFSYRKKIATKNNITNYKGTSSQNIKMLNLAFCTFPTLPVLWGGLPLLLYILTLVLNHQ